MSEKEQLEEAEKIFFTHNISGSEQIKALNTIYKILKDCKIGLQIEDLEVLRRRIARAKGILDTRET